MGVLRSKVVLQWWYGGGTVGGTVGTGGRNPERCARLTASNFFIFPFNLEFIRPVL